jgi:hypothetical protein
MNAYSNQGLYDRTVECLIKTHKLQCLKFKKLRDAN